MDSVFLVEAVFDYTGTKTIRVFEDRDDAEAFVVACETYETSRPPQPTDEAPLLDYQLWSALTDEWLKDHPAGDIGAPNAFRIIPLPFVRKQDD